MNKLYKLSNDELIDIIQNIFENIIIDPAYKVYTKSFAIEYLKKSLAVCERYKKLKLTLVVFPFNPKGIAKIKHSLRDSDLVAKFDNLLLIILTDTSKNGALKVCDRLNKILYKKGDVIDIKPTDNIDNILNKINMSIHEV
jgi:hypothetical protein